MSLLSLWLSRSSPFRSPQLFLRLATSHLTPTTGFSRSRLFVITVSSATTSDYHDFLCHDFLPSRLFRHFSVTAFLLRLLCASSSNSSPAMPIPGRTTEILAVSRVKSELWKLWQEPCSLRARKINNGQPRENSHLATGHYCGQHG